MGKKGKKRREKKIKQGKGKRKEGSRFQARFIKENNKIANSVVPIRVAIK